MCKIQMSSPFSLFSFWLVRPCNNPDGSVPFFSTSSTGSSKCSKRKKKKKSQKEDFFKYKQLTSGRGISSSFPRYTIRTAARSRKRKRKEKVVSGRLVCLFPSNPPGLIHFDRSSASSYCVILRS